MFFEILYNDAEIACSQLSSVLIIFTDEPDSTPVVVRQPLTGINRLYLTAFRYSLARKPVKKIQRSVK